MRQPPGQLLLALARRLMAHAELERVIEPAIADLQHEWSTSASAPAVTRAAIRVRAYLCVLRVVVPRLLANGVRIAWEPPPWPLLRPVVARFVLIAVVTTVIGAFGPASARTREHWFFYLPDRLLWWMPMLPAGVGWLQTWHSTRVLRQLRASDVAKLSVAVALCCLAWSGWVAPLVRQQYLLALNLDDFVGASVHQWTLGQLIAGLGGSPAIPAAVVATELHMRLAAPALALACGVLGWTSTRAALLWSHGVGLAISGVGLVLLVILLRVGGFATPALSSQRIRVEWLCMVALCVLAIVLLRAIDRVGRRRRPILEARALELLQALPASRQAELVHK